MHSTPELLALTKLVHHLLVSYEWCFLLFVTLMQRTWKLTIRTTAHPAGRPLTWKLAPHWRAEVKAIFFLNYPHDIAFTANVFIWVAWYLITCLTARAAIDYHGIRILIWLHGRRVNSAQIVALLTAIYDTWWGIWRTVLLKMEVTVQTLILRRHRWRFSALVTKHEVWYLLRCARWTVHWIGVLELDPEIIELQHHKLRHHVVKIFRRMQINWNIVAILHILNILLVMNEFLTIKRIEKHHSRVWLIVLIDKVQFENAH